MKTLKPEEVFEYLHDNFKYIAKCPTGRWFAYVNEPKIMYGCSDGWWPGIGADPLFYSSHFNIHIDFNGDWKDSLHCRHASPINLSFQSQKPLDERDELIKHQKEEISRLCDTIIRHENTIDDLGKQISILKLIVHSSK